MISCARFVSCLAEMLNSVNVVGTHSAEVAFAKQGVTSLAKAKTVQCAAAKNFEPFLTSKLTGKSGVYRCTARIGTRAVNGKEKSMTFKIILRTMVVASLRN